MLTGLSYDFQVNVLREEVTIHLSYIIESKETLIKPIDFIFLGGMILEKGP